MDIQEINKYQQKIYALLEKNEVFKALLELAQLIEATANYQLQEKFNQVKTSYHYMLQYVAEGAADPQREEIFADIINSTYDLTDRCVFLLSSNRSYELFYTRTATMQQMSVDDLIERYQNARKRYTLLQSVEVRQQNATAIKAMLQECERLETEIFNKTWCTFPFSPHIATSIKALIDDDSTPGYFKSLIVSALFLSLTKFFDEKKLAILLETYITATNLGVQVRALTGAVIIIYQYRTRVQQIKSIGDLIETAAEMKHFQSDSLAILNRLIRSRNTEKITQKMREDFMPNLMQMSPELMKKIKGNGGTLDPSELEGNPEWQEWLDNSGIGKKMEELNKIQQEGGDVYISTFAHLKSFPFFNTLSNWFLPFNIEHSTLHDTFSTGDKTLKQLIEAAPFMCDSDKYSFSFSLGSIPANQRSMIVSQLDAQATGMKEADSAMLPDDNLTARDMAINSYTQDLYRFFKLFSRRGDFLSIFKTEMDFLNLPYFSKITNNTMTITLIAEFYLKNAFYGDAIKYYHFLLDKNEEIDPHILQKMGFAHQNLGDFHEAIKFYKRYELAKENDSWNLKHIAACYRALKMPQKALEYFLKAETVAPNNATIYLNIGHCLLEANQIEEALKYYFKADYLDPQKHKAWRPIAWCSFLNDKKEQSERYYQKIINNDTPTAQDHLNYGHLLLSNNQVKDAITQYLKAAGMMENNAETFVRLYTNDKHYVRAKGLSEATITLVCEAVTSKLLG